MQVDNVVDAAGTPMLQNRPSHTLHNLFASEYYMEMTFRNSINRAELPSPRSTSQNTFAFLLSQAISLVLTNHKKEIRQITSYLKKRGFNDKLSLYTIFRCHVA